MKRLSLIILTLLLCLTMARGKTYAHVLITDTTKSRGAILHFSPNDEPIAGQQSVLMLDMQNRLPASGSKAIVEISQVDNSQLQIIEAIITDSLAIFNYTFPSPGVYDLSFTVTTTENSYTYKYSQRVSGSTDMPDTSQRHRWAELLLIASTIGLALTLIVMVNRRQEISSQSSL